MQKFSERDFTELENIIKESKEPILFEYKNYKFAITLTQAGKEKYLREGYIAFTVSELKQWIGNEKELLAQQVKAVKMLKNLIEGFDVANYVIQQFDGKAEIKELKARIDKKSKIIPF